MILLRLAMVENKQGIRKMPASGHDDCNLSSKGRLPRIVILASTLLHLGFPATPHGNGAANALARAEDVIDSARIELPQMCRFSDIADLADDVCFVGAKRTS